MKLKYTLLAALILSAPPKAALADNLIEAEISDVPLSLGITSAYTYAMSGNGLVGGGTSQSGQILRWVSDGTPSGTYAHAISPLVGYNAGIVFGASFDGHIIVGSSSDTNTGTQQAFRWISDSTATGGTIHGLGFLPGDDGSIAWGVNNDGTVVVGSSSFVTSEAFRWVSDGTATGGTMHGLGFLAGDTDSRAYGTSADGSVVVGTSEFEAFRWVSDGTLTGGTMHSIGFLAGGSNSAANAVNADGTVVVGSSDDGTDSYAVRWVSDGTATGGTMLSLGSLDGGTFGIAFSVSADGKMITGVANDASTTKPFLWTEEDGMRALDDILTDSGVDISDWSTLANDEGRTYISADGTRIMGSGVYNGEEVAYLMTITALTTPEELQKSLSSAPLSMQQGSNAVVSGVGQSLMIARNALSMYIPRPATSASNPRIASADPAVLSDVEPAAGGTYTRSGNFGHAFYAIGNLGIGQENNFSNYGASGATGLLIGITDDFAIGAGLVGSHSRIETNRGGNSTVDAWGVSTMISYEPASGFRLYGTASIVPLDISTRRNYMNGGGTDSSRGETEGTGYGIAARTGWSFPVDDTKSVMPYVEAQWSKTKIDGYTEQGGGIPASYADQDTDSWISRLGAEYSQAVTPDVTFRLRGAWGHRYGDAGSVVTTAMGITQTISGAPGDRDWAEGGLGAVWRISDRTSLSADLSGRAGKTGEPAVGILLGLTVGF